MNHRPHPQDETTGRVVTLGTILGLLAFVELLVILGIGYRL